MNDGTNLKDTCMQRFAQWQKEATDPEIQSQLAQMDESQIVDAFYRDLAFGTGGLRGVIGAGTNRMNIYTVGKASQGLADYLNQHFDKPSVVIGFDSRILSDVFAVTAARVLMQNGIRVLIWPRLLPVPTVSFAVRFLHASAGIMITASHNPSKYNGYKVYGADGCQITTDAADEILAQIEKLDLFRNVKKGTSAPETIPENVLDAYIEEVRNQSVLFGDQIDRNVAIVYSPLNGTGREPVTRALRELGYTNVQVVKEQEFPDGHFPTCPYPNPEIREAMALGMEYARKYQADLLLATDPDCDRVGIAVRNASGDYTLLTGNETGLLLLDYICSQRAKHGQMPDSPVMVKTIVTTDLADKIASHWGVQTRNVLTGFKFIGEQIGLMEKEGHPEKYIFGFEESYGCLTGTYVRDKDGVNGASMICEMFAYYATRGISLTERLNQLYEQFGYCQNTLHSYEFDGAAGFDKMQRIMRAFRGSIGQIGPVRVIKTEDYSSGLNGLPPSDVLKFYLENGCSAVVRPSGTEPKLKIYLSISAADQNKAEALEKELCKALEQYLQ